MISLLLQSLCHTQTCLPFRIFRNRSVKWPKITPCSAIPHQTSLFRKIGDSENADILIKKVITRNKQKAFANFCFLLLTSVLIFNVFPFFGQECISLGLRGTVDYFAVFVMSNNFWETKTKLIIASQNKISLLPFNFQLLNKK